MKMQVKIDDKTFDVDIDDISARPITVRVDGQVFTVWPETAQSAPLQAITQPAASMAQPTANLPASQPSAGASFSQVRAPIPGVIIEISAKPGDAVAYGQQLCILEAMKMKNSIRASREGIIDQVLISTNDQVNQNQVLMTYRDEKA